MTKVHYISPDHLSFDIIGATSLEAFDGILEPFAPQLHEIRQHKGQIETAKNIRMLLKGSEIMMQAKKHIQDSYSFRCIPQVHGATKDSVEFITDDKVVSVEIENAVKFIQESELSSFES